MWPLVYAVAFPNMKYNKKAMLLFQSVKLDTQALIAASNVSIQIMDGNAYWSVTVQKIIAIFLSDVWKSRSVSPTLY